MKLERTVKFLISIFQKSISKHQSIKISLIEEDQRPKRKDKLQTPYALYSCS
ncbi:hypothetical protein MtrunA17_Chr8g0358591 [Medicago truncatula]|uniref:Uncharacterized protein n=1 Tax=Medicago truncatula TaxID=3880 RepID=A0A396GI18_MEDTR|nr:hypothetical protein MtrunA17_Chr8g0358591 [Medicago truncatula]